MATSDTPIVISGGSVSIELHENTFPGKGGKHSNVEKTIVSVEITDDNTGQTQTIATPANGKCTIRINAR